MSDRYCSLGCNGGVAERRRGDIVAVSHPVSANDAVVAFFAGATRAQPGWDVIRVKDGEPGSLVGVKSD